MDAKKIRQQATEAAEIAADVGGRFWHDYAQALEQAAKHYEAQSAKKKKPVKGADEDE